MIDDIVVGFEYAVGEPVVAHELPDIFDRVQFGTSRRKRHEGDIGGHDQFGGSVPSGLIEDNDRMRAVCDVNGYFRKMKAHGRAVAIWHYDPGCFTLSRADGSEQPCRSAALVLGR